MTLNKLAGDATASGKHLNETVDNIRVYLVSEILTQVCFMGGFDSVFNGLGVNQIPNIEIEKEVTQNK